MAQFRNVSGQALWVPELRAKPVDPDEIITVPDSRIEGYAYQVQTWERVDSISAETVVTPSVTLPAVNETPAEIAAAQNVAEPSAAQQIAAQQMAGNE